MSRRAILANLLIVIPGDATFCDTWCRRQSITPRHEASRLLGPLDVYVLLPKLNCHACGEATCMAFAFELLLGGRRLPECLRLQEPEHEAGARRLRELLECGANLPQSAFGR